MSESTGRQVSEALPQTTKPIHPALQRRERRLYVHTCTQDVCVRLRKKKGGVKIFWMSGINAGNRERIFQGGFTHDFRKIDYKKDVDLLNYISQKQNRINRMGKTVKLRLRGGDEEQKPETNTKEPLTKKE